MSGHANVGGAYELRFELRFAVFQQHLDDLAQICLKLIERRSLAMRAGPSRDGTNEQTGRGISLDDGCEIPHDFKDHSRTEVDRRPRRFWPLSRRSAGGERSGWRTAGSSDARGSDPMRKVTACHVANPRGRASFLSPPLGEVYRPSWEKVGRSWRASRFGHARATTNTGNGRCAAHAWSGFKGGAACQRSCRPQSTSVADGSRLVRCTGSQQPTQQCMWLATVGEYWPRQHVAASAMSLRLEHLARSANAGGAYERSV
jgi:hypothetical protein